MHVERIHKMVEKLTEVALCELNKGTECVDTEEFGEVVDAIKDLCEAEKCALIAKQMKKDEEEEKREDKYFLDMLKEEYKDDYKRMKDEYGDGEETDRRFYDNYRYKSSGKFAPKGSGSYMPRSSGRRRGYEEPMYHMMPDMYNERGPEYWRDLDREQGKMYFTPMSVGNTAGGRNASDGSNSGNTRSYSDGYSEGSKRGYEEGYSDAAMNAKKFESRYDNVKRNYTETKAAHKGNTQEDNAENMKFLEKVLNFIDGELKELTPGMSAQEKAMTKQKLSAWAQRT